MAEEDRTRELLQWLHLHFVTEGHFTEQGSLGLIVNLYYENSTLNPGRVEGDRSETAYGRGYGLAQWTDNSESQGTNTWDRGRFLVPQ